MKNHPFLRVASRGLTFLHGLGVLSLITVGLAACSPRVEVVAPAEPITINLNVKIDHEVRVKVEKELDQVLSPDSPLF